MAIKLVLKNPSHQTKAILKRGVKFRLPLYVPVIDNGKFNGVVLLPC